MKKILICLIAIFVFTACQPGEIDRDGNFVVPSDIDVTYSKGNANASVVITEYSEYECPFCSKFTLETLPQLQNDYIETGKVLFVFKDFPIPNHKFAQKASEATYCAGEQNEEKFWELHVKLFENQKNLAIEDILKYGEELDLNVNALASCIESGKYEVLVLRNRQDGLNAEVNATPTLMVNDEKIVGHQPYENLVKIIETQLKK